MWIDVRCGCAATGASIAATVGVAGTVVGPGVTGWGISRGEQAASITQASRIAALRIIDLSSRDSAIGRCC
jgi:hypothetical protein